MKSKSNFDDIKKLIQSGLSVKEINEKLGLVKNRVYELLNYNGTTFTKLRDGIETISKKEKKPVAKKENKVGTPTTTPAWVTIFRKEWEEKCANEPRKGAKAHITNYYIDKIKINFSEEKKQIERENKKKLREEKKAQKQADIERIKLEKKAKKKESKKEVEKVLNLPFKYIEYTPANEVKRQNVLLVVQNASLKAENESLKSELRSYRLSSRVA